MADLREVQHLGFALLAEHGLRCWRFKWDGAKKRFGQCNRTNRTISLSRPLTEINDIELARHTILHEIAHALVGPGHGHGPVWRAQARLLGIAADRCVVATPPPSKYVAYCEPCATTHGGFERMPSRRYVCAKTRKPIKIIAAAAAMPREPRGYSAMIDPEYGFIGISVRIGIGR